MRTIVGLKPALIALAVSMLSIIVLAAFTVAPLLVVVPVAAGMWGSERYNNRRHQAGSRTPRSRPGSRREVDDRQPASAEQSFAFGSAIGREL